jgi:hypothetical protein
LLKKSEKGTFTVSSLSEAREAATLLEERNEAIRDVEKIMNEEYDYAEMKAESVALKFAIEDFLVKKNRKALGMKGYRWQLIRPVNRSWDRDRLRELVGKATFLKLVKTEVDPDKVDEFVRSGKLKLNVIEEALIELPKKPYIKRYESSDDAADEEADRVRKAMA